MNDTAEFVALAVVLGLACSIIAGGWYVAKLRRARLARLHEAPTISVESISSSRTLVVFFAGALITAGSVPFLMPVVPKAPAAVVVWIGFAFAAALAPLTFARRLTVDCRLVLDSQSLRFERRGAHPVVVDLAQPFTLESARVDDEVSVLVEQGAARLLFSYRHGPAFVTLPLSPFPAWIKADERVACFGEEARVIHQRLRSPS